MQEMLSESWYYQHILREGREKGREEGCEELSREITPGIIRKRFPSLLDLAQKQLLLIKKSEALVQLAMRLGQAESLEEVERCLRKATEEGCE